MHCNVDNIKFNKNEDSYKLLISDLNHKLEKIYLGGGKKKLEKQHSKGKMSARERIENLIKARNQT